jgi:hypothetical protein
MRILRVAALGAALGGCASTQLNLNTLNLAGTIDKLLLSQVVYNLSNFHGNHGALPSQVGIAAGTTTTNLSLTPSLAGIPVDNSSTTARTVAAAASSTVTTVRAAASITAGGTDTSTQTWTLDPYTDPGDLNRLRALYRYAVDDNYSEAKLFNDYVVQSKSVTPPSPPGAPPKVTYDDSFRLYPNCVKCLISTIPQSLITNALQCGADLLGGPQQVCLNPKLIEMKHFADKNEYGWLLFDKPPPSENYGEYSVFGQHSFSAEKTELTDFALLTLNATATSSSGATGSGKSKLFITTVR